MRNSLLERWTSWSWIQNRRMPGLSIIGFKSWNVEQEIGGDISVYIWYDWKSFSSSSKERLTILISKLKIIFFKGDVDCHTQITLKNIQRQVLSLNWRWFDRSKFGRVDGHASSHRYWSVLLREYTCLSVLCICTFLGSLKYKGYD